METGLRQINTLLFPLVLQARSEAAPQAAPLQSALVVILHQQCRNEGAISAGDLRLRLPYIYFIMYSRLLSTQPIIRRSSSLWFCRRALHGELFQQVLQALRRRSRARPLSSRASSAEARGPSGAGDSRLRLQDQANTFYYVFLLRTSWSSPQTLCLLLRTQLSTIVPCGAAGAFPLGAALSAAPERATGARHLRPHLSRRRIPKWIYVYGCNTLHLRVLSSGQCSKQRRSERPKRRR